MNTNEKLCPVNFIPLKTIDYEGVAVDQCSLCGGIWCDEGELGEIVKRKIAKFDAETIKNAKDYNFPSLQLETNKVKIEARKCAVCKEGMVKIDYSGSIKVLIERCPKGHGVWLDENELERIQILEENSKRFQQT